MPMGFNAGTDPEIVDFVRCVAGVQKGTHTLLSMQTGRRMPMEQTHVFRFVNRRVLNTPKPPMAQLRQLMNDLVRGNCTGITAHNIHVGPGETEHEFEIVEFVGAVSGYSRSIPTGWDVRELKPALADGGTIIEPFIGYRDFDLIDKDDPYDPTLLSRNGVAWPLYEKLIATCNGDPFAKHDAPNIDCNCGIYAFRTPNHRDLSSHANVWGEIYLWGRVIEAPHGFRGEYAYPKTLFVRDTGTKIVRVFAQSLEKAYGVPVHLVETREGQTAGAIIDTALNRILRGGETDTPDAGTT